jgi:hypothetical protein
MPRGSLHADEQQSTRTSMVMSSKEGKVRPVHDCFSPDSKRRRSVESFRQASSFLVLLQTTPVVVPPQHGSCTSPPPRHTMFVSDDSSYQFMDKTMSNSTEPMMQHPQRPSPMRSPCKCFTSFQRLFRRRSKSFLFHTPSLSMLYSHSSVSPSLHV